MKRRRRPPAHHGPYESSIQAFLSGRVSRLQKILALLVVQSLLLTLFVAGAIVERGHQHDEIVELDRRHASVELKTLQDIGKYLGVHARASRTRTCADASLTVFSLTKLKGVEITPAQRERLLTYLTKACIYVPPAPSEERCPEGPAVAQMLQASVPVAPRALPEKINTHGYVFAGPSHVSDKFKSDQIAEAMDRRLPRHGPFRIFKLREDRELVRLSSWRTRREALDTFPRIIKTTNVGTRLRIERKDSPKWWLGVKVVNYPLGEQVIDLAKTKIGARYVYGSSGPTTFDCSGLTSWSWATAAHIFLPHNAEAQRNAAVRVAEPKPGDLIVWDFEAPYGGGASHVGLWLRPGYTLDARNPYDGPVAVRRIEGAPYFLGFYRPKGV